MTPALSIKQLTKIYRNGFTALRGIDLDVKQGDFFALLGPNGAGKSTTIGIVSSLVNKTSGSVHIFGHDLETEITAAKSCIGLVPQEFNFNVFEPVEEIVVNQGGFYGMSRARSRERAEVLLKQLELWEKRRNQARELSGGMKRRLMIARALVHEPKLLILDEPTAGVDVEIRYSMWEFLRKINREGTTIILTTHYLEEAENLCRNIAIIDDGKILHNTTMKALLGQLNTETFVLDVSPTQSAAPQINGYTTRLVDDSSIEIDVIKHQGLNGAFNELQKQNITVSSMRNKVNRLEELFLSLTKSNRGLSSGDVR